jgi:hypothetical protein
LHGDHQVEQEGPSSFPLENAAMHTGTSQTVAPGGNSTEERHGSLPNPHSSPSYMDEDWGEVVDARPILPKAAFFMGDLRDGLPMVSAVL